MKTIPEFDLAADDGLGLWRLQQHFPKRQNGQHLAAAVLWLLAALVVPKVIPKVLEWYKD